MKSGIPGRGGFTLIEVLVALAVLSMAITTLLVVRNDAIAEAGEAMENRRLRGLLEQQMGKFAAGLEKGAGGDFRDVGQPNYMWRAEVEPHYVAANDELGKARQIALRKVTLHVWHRGRSEKRSLVAYFADKRPEDM